MDGDRQLQHLLAAARDDADVLAVVLYGSRARREAHAGRTSTSAWS